MLSGVPVALVEGVGWCTSGAIETMWLEQVSSDFSIWNCFSGRYNTKVHRPTPIPTVQIPGRICPVLCREVRICPGSVGVGGSHGYKLLGDGECYIKKRFSAEHSFLFGLRPEVFLVT